MSSAPSGSWARRFADAPNRRLDSGPMHDDPTQRMPADQPPPPGGYQQGGYPQGGYPPPQPGMSGAHKALIALLAAIIIGLGVAVALIATGDDSSDEPTASTETTTATETSTSDPTTTTETTTSTETTTTTTSTADEGSGGSEAP